MRNFPFDRQNLKIVLESVGIPSSTVHLVPDARNSLVSEELQISGWKIDELQMESHKCEYQSTLGDPSGQIGEYLRIVAYIPLSRTGWRLFINSFLGFFISFIIISLIYFLDVNSRIGLIMRTIFAAVGNKYTSDTCLPNQSAFSLSDLIQICSFGMIPIAIVTTIVCMRLERADKHRQAKKMDRLVQSIFVPAYIVLIAMGTFLAVRGQEKRSKLNQASPPREP